MGKRTHHTTAPETKMRHVPLSLESLEADGAFAGYASVFDVVDSHKDVIRPGAFSNTITENQNIKLLWQHRTDEPIGLITELREDANGLYVEGQLQLEVQRAQEAYALLKSGAIEGLSIGYSVVASEFDAATGYRILTELALWEISLVTFPSNQSAKVVAVKDGNMPGTVREFEHFLREAGFSRKMARDIASAGFDGAEDGPREAVTDNALIQLDQAIDSALLKIRITN